MFRQTERQKKVTQSLHSFGTGFCQAFNELRDAEDWWGTAKRLGGNYLDLARPQFIYKLATNSEAKPTAQLLAQEFAANEPLSLALGITATEIYPQFLKIVEHAISKKMCLIAKTRRTNDQPGQVVSTMILRDLKDPVLTNGIELCPKSAPIFALMSSLPPPETFMARKNDKALEIQLAATNSAYTNRGIVSKMALSLGKIIILRGYKHAFATLTNRRSQHAFLRGIGRKMAGVPCQSFSYQNKMVFAKVSDPEEVILGYIEITGLSLLGHFRVKVGKKSANRNPVSSIPSNG